LQSSECLEVCEDIGYTQTSAQKHKVSQGFWLYSANQSGVHSIRLVGSTKVQLMDC
ncbi:unnamed protein product, partial [Musa hybrid cultivar]